MTKLSKALLLASLVFAFQLTLGSADLPAANQVRVACPVLKPTIVVGDSVAIPVHITNDSDLGGISLGFHYNSDQVEITSISLAGSVIPAGALTFVQKKFVPADNEILIGWIDFSTFQPIPAQTDGLIFTLNMKLLPGVTAQWVDIDSAFVAPAGPFIFSPQAGGKISPAYSDCGTQDIQLGTPPAENHQPNAICQAVTVNANGTCQADASTNNGSNDPDAGQTITLSQTPAGPYPLGVTNVMLIVTDNGTPAMSDTCFADVTVQDKTKPAIACPANIVKVNDAGQAGAIVTFTVTATDACDPAPVIVATPSSGSFFPIGITAVKAIATDASGNADTCNFTVTINENQKPIVSGIPDQILPYGSTFATINLDNYVADPDNTPSQMTWTYAGNVQLLVSISPARVATISKPSPSWSGSESIIFTATDPGLLSDPDTAIFTIAAPTPLIKITPDTLVFTGYAGGANPAGQGAMITNIGNGTLDWTAAEATAWFSLTSASGTAPSGFTVNVDITGLAPGDYAGDVTVSSIQATNSPRILKVILHVTSPVDIKLTPDSLNFYARQGSPNPAGQNVAITNAIPSGVEFDWSAVETSPWLSLSATSGRTPSTLGFTADITGLAVGTYNTIAVIKETALIAGVTEDIDTVYVKLIVDLPTGIEDDHGSMPKSYSLEQNYPNPFNPETAIEYNLASPGNVTLTVYNVIGQKVVDVVNGFESAGTKQATWNGKDANGHEVQSGVYFYRLTTDNFSMTRKMMLLK